jgi:hypothetical protein
MVNHIRINGEALIASTGEGIQKDDRQGTFACPTFRGIKRNNFHKAYSFVVLATWRFYTIIKLLSTVMKLLFDMIVQV